jgi:hypothetical protein
VCNQQCLIVACHGREAHLARALDDLLDSAQAVTRTLLGVGVDPADLPAGGALSLGPGPGMMARRR